MAGPKKKTEPNPGDRVDALEGQVGELTARLDALEGVAKGEAPKPPVCGYKMVEGALVTKTFPGKLPDDWADSPAAL